MPIYYQLSNLQLPITLESIGNHWQQDRVQRSQGYPFYHWLQTETGQGELWLEKERIVLKPGEGILIAPFIPHSYFSNESWQTNFATFEGRLSDSFPLIIGAKNYYLCKDNSAFSFSQWIDTIIQQHKKKQLDSADLSISCYQFLLNISSQQNILNKEEHQLKDRYIAPVIAEIETNYQTGLTVEMLAQKNFVSQQYLSRLFKRFMGKSPYQYLTDYRIGKAKELLVNHREIEIQEIGLRVGFQSPSQFSAMFLNRTGYTPKKFRKLYFDNDE